MSRFAVRAGVLFAIAAVVGCGKIAGVDEYRTCATPGPNGDCLSGLICCQPHFCAGDGCLGSPCCTQNAWQLGFASAYPGAVAASQDDDFRASLRELEAQLPQATAETRPILEQHIAALRSAGSCS